MLGRLRCALVVVMILSSAVGASPRTTLVGQHPSWANPANDRGLVGSRALAHLTVRLVRPPDKQAAFDALLAAQQTPGSPEYHRWLTPVQIGRRFGASDADIAAVTSWLTGAGFKVLRVSNSKSFVEIAGTTDVAAKAFGVEFHDYAVRGKTLMSIDREPTIPTRLATIIAGVHGLHQQDIRPLFVRGPSGHLGNGEHAHIVDTSGNHYVGVADFSTIYDLGPLSTLKGTGQVIGIIGRSQVLPADISNFGTVMGITMPTPSIVIPPTGVDPGTPCGDSSCASTAAFDDQEEATLDVTRAGSVAPGATIQLIVSASTTSDDGTDIALEYAVDSFGMGSTANIINLSFGTCEAIDSSGQADAMQLDTFYAQAAMQGQSVFVSAGDSGAADCQLQGEPQDANLPTTASVNILATSGNVTCMGGTKFADADAQGTYWDSGGSAVSYIPEGAWNEDVITFSDNTMLYVQLGGGGGESMYIAKPSFQSNVGPSGSKRLVPDVSFDSATIEGYVVCLAGLGADCADDTNTTFTSVGGTSAAAPDMAGVAALVDESTGSNQGNLNPTLYMLGADSSNHVFHDVTVASSGVGTCDVNTPSLCNNTDPGPSGPSGGTVGYAVANGFDEATGWGSIDIAQLLAHWPGAAPVPMLSIDPTSLTVLEGQTGTVSLDATGFTGTPTFACGSGLPSNATCSFSGTTLTITVAAEAAGVSDAGSRLRWLLLAVGLALLAGARGRLRTRGRRIGVITVFAITVGSCGGSSNNGADAKRLIDAGPPVAHTVMITATSGAESARASLTLTSN